MAPCAELDASEDQRIQAYATADAAELQVGLPCPACIMCMCALLFNIHH